MKGSYQELQQMNEELISEYTKRATNHSCLMQSLKLVNDMIQMASNLRYGSAKTSVIKACRKAIKKNNLRSLMHIISNGKA
jgi:Bardet-Biedl syndrome 2 protein